MSQKHISYVDVRFSVHATEDPDKVIKAVQQVLPADYIEEILFKKKSLRGDYRNPITLFETRMEEKDVIEAFLKRLFSNLREHERESLLGEIDLHVEKGSLYIRLDKQAAFRGEIKLCKADPIRVRVRFRKKRIEDILKICQELGL